MVTGGGVTLCIDTTLDLRSQMLGQHVADETARIMEHQRAGAPTARPLRRSWRGSEGLFVGKFEAIPHQFHPDRAFGPRSIDS